MTQPQSSPGTSSDALFAVVLAAGMATRYGSTKQLAIWQGESLVRRATKAAEALCGSNSLLVLGCEWRRVYEAAGAIEGFLVRNERYEEGMGTSIAAAAAALPDSAEAVLILLADQPLIGAADLTRIADAWRQDRRAIVCSRAGEVIGPPVIFPRDLFDELRALDGDRGARSVIERHRERLREIEMAEAGVDVDVPRDLEALNADTSP